MTWIWLIKWIVFWILINIIASVNYYRPEIGNDITSIVTVLVGMITYYVSKISEE